MSDHNTIQLPQTDEFETNGPNDPSGQGRQMNYWYIVALIFAVILAAGVGFLGGQTNENNKAEETLDAITAIAEQNEQAQLDANQTATAIVKAYTATPTATDLPSATPTPEIPQGQILAYGVAVYDAPLVGADQIDTLNQDAQVDIIGIAEDGQWFEIAYHTMDGTAMSGFVAISALRVTGGMLDNIDIAAIPTNTPTPSPTSLPTLTPSPTIPPTPVTPQAVVLPIAVHVHEGPGNEFEVVGQLNQGSLVDIASLSQDGNWIGIAYSPPDGASPINGFVEASSLSLSAGSLENVAVMMPPTATALPSRPVIQPAGAILAVHIGPDRRFDIVGIVEAGTRLEVTAVSPDGQWFQVRFPQSLTGLGWVAIESVNIEGLVQRLPIVRGPALPEPTPVAVVVTPQETAIPPTAVPTLVPTPIPLRVPIVTLPTNTVINLDNIPDLEAYAYEVALTIHGDIDGQPYEAYLNLTTVQADNQNKLILDATGDVQDIDAELLLLLPLTIGIFDGQNYIYTEGDDVCIATEEDLDTQFLLDDFPGVVGTGGQTLVDVVRELGVFGLIPDDGLLGLGGNHYQFLGYDDGAGGFSPTDDMKVDLWWTENDDLLYATSMTFKFGSDSRVPDELFAELNPNAQITGQFTGVANIHVLPVAIDSDAIRLAAPPSACVPMQ